MELKKLPNLTFAESDPVVIDSNITTTVEALLGRKLSRADPLRLFLRGIEALMIQQRLLIDETAKQGLLAYATGNNLDHIGVLVGTDRLTATPATTKVMLNLAEQRNVSTIIPAGIRITAGDGVMFKTVVDVAIPAGFKSIEVTAICTENGASGNDYNIGEINQIVDPIRFLESAVNTTISAGGADTESDDEYRKRISEAPEQFSTAGPDGAYKYHAKQASSLICDVSVDSPAPGEVVIRPLLKGGELPTTEIIEKVSAILNNRKIRPLTDKVEVESPVKIEYDIELSYWIDREDTTEAIAIQSAAESAVNEYIAWQRAQLGRDINPTELYYRLRMAGVKRAEIIEPMYTVVKNEEVAIAKEIYIRFEGLEDG